MFVEASSKIGLSSALGELGLAVSPRPHRTHDEREWYCLRRYVLTLAHHDLLVFPLRIQKNETPDFIFTGISTFGLEVVEATDPVDQREFSLAAKSGQSAWLQGAFGGRGSGGFVGSAHEQLWLSYLRHVVERKLDLDYSTPVTRILIYSNSNAGGHVNETDAQELIGRMLRVEPTLQRLWQRSTEISVIKGRHLIFDAGGVCQLLLLRQ